MLELRDYLDLTRDEARAQWASIIMRAPIDAGRRQGDFTPVETLLCFALGLTTAPGVSGRINLRESDPNVIALASLFKRSPGSLALKLANLDGRRENGAKHEQDLWIALTSDSLLPFEHLYQVLLEAGRSVGLEPDRLPDVLGSESGTFDAVLDADRVSTAELIVSVEGEVREWHDAHPGSDLSTTEKLMLGSARVGQKRFAFSVLNNCDFECVFCGLGFRSVGLPPSRMLVAGHIKSWSASDNRERLDVRNGLAACPTHDAAFDTFLISLSDDLRVLRTDALESARQMDAAVDRNFGAAGMRERIRFSESATPPSSDYLAWHRARSLQEIGGYAYG